MTSQMTNGIFASAHPVVHAPTTRPVKQPTSGVKLVVTDAEGQVLQSWAIKQAKCTLGSADSCTICCNLPGIAPVHALIVSGARQLFVRSLAGKLSQDGIPASELLLSDQKSYFELASYRFSLIRQSFATNEEERLQAKRMRFALARPLSITSHPEPVRQPQSEDNLLSSPWVANIIREAIEPLEAQIDSLLLPLAEFQAQSMQAQLSAAKELEEERRRTELEKQRAYEEEFKAKQLAADRLRESEEHRKIKEQEIVSMVAQQSANMETLTERISDVNNQLATIERIIAQDAQLTANSNAQTNSFIVQTNDVIAVQQTAIEQLQTGMVSVSESLKQLQERQQAAQNENLSWKNEVQLQLQQLTSAVSEFSEIAKNPNQPELIDAIESLKSTHEEAQVEIQRWQEGVQKQLGVLQDKLEDASTSAREEIPNRLASAIAEIQSKHEQSLAELQVWKAELREEMQQIFLTASRTQAQVAVSNSAETAPSLPSTPINLPIASLAADSVLESNQLLSRPIPSQPDSETNSWRQGQSSWNSTVPTVVPELSSTPTPPASESTYPTFQQPSSSPSDTTLSSQDDGLYYGAEDTQQETVIESEQVFSSFLGQQFTPELAEPITPEFVSEEMIGAVEQQLQAQSNPGWDLNLPPESTEQTQWPSLMLEPHDSSTAFGNQWAPQAEAGLLENNFEANSQGPAPSFLASTDSPSESLSELDTASTASPAETESPASLDSHLPNWNSAAYSPDPQNAFASLLRQDHQASQPPNTASQELVRKELDQTELGTAKHSTIEHSLAEHSLVEHSEEVHQQTDHDQTALPSWWTECVKEDEAETACQEQPTAQEQVASAGYDLSHLYGGSEKDSPATSSQSLSSDNLESNQPDNGLVDTSSQAFSFDRFVQREQQLESEQGIYESGSGSTTGLPQATTQTEPGASYVPETPLSSRTPALVEEYQQIEEVQYQLPDAYQKLGTDSSTSTPNQARTSVNQGSSTSGDEEDDSVEAYMKNLLARMRGEPENAPASQPVQPATAAPSSYAPTRTSPYELRNAMREEQLAMPEDVEPMDLDTYVPLTNAPEKTKNISALRELANSTARTAIHKSTRRKTLSGSLMKFAISAIALTVAAALFAINGLAVNIALIATMAALFVALIWGYDGLKSLKPLLQNSLVLQPQANTNEPSDPEDE